MSVVLDIATAAASLAIAYLLQKPYVRIVKIFHEGTGKIDPTTYKVKNAGAATALNIVVQDRLGQAVDLDVKLGHRVRYVDAVPPGAEIKVTVPGAPELVCVYYENLFGLLFHTQLTDAGDRFRMTCRKTWPVVHKIPKGVRDELPEHRWRRG